MMVKTHVLGGITFAMSVSYLTGYLLPAGINSETLSVSNFAQIGAFTVYVWSSGAGSMVLDIDKKESTISSRHKIISFFVRLLCTHRGFTHSLLALILFAGALYFPARNYCPALLPIVYGLSTGYASHIFLDMLNPKGCRLLFPSKKMVSLFKIKTESLAEKFFNVFQIVTIVILFSKIYLKIN